MILVSLLYNNFMQINLFIHIFLNFSRCLYLSFYSFQCIVKASCMENRLY